MPVARSGRARSTTLCVDASIVIRRLKRDHPAVLELWNRIMRDRVQLVAPLLLRYEVTNVLHRLGRAGDIPETEVTKELARAFGMPIEYHDEVGLHAEAVRIAAKHGLPAAYDAHYLALAERLGVDFFTTDARLAKAVGDDLPWVRLVR